MKLYGGEGAWDYTDFPFRDDRVVRGKYNLCFEQTAWLESPGLSSLTKMPKSEIF